MNILDNELVMKYFFDGCQCDEGCEKGDCVQSRWFMAFNIIQAQQDLCDGMAVC